MATSGKAEIIVELKNVVKNYTLGETKVAALRGVDLALNKGEFTAVIGASGSGKSTIVNLLARLYDPVSGSIRLDKHNTKDMNLEYFRSLIGYVAQEPVLFNTTIRENIIFGRKDVTEEEILEVII